MRAALVAAACAASALAFDPPTALQFAYHAAAAYCDPATVNNWSCRPCQLAGDAVNVTAVTDRSVGEGGGDVLLHARGAHQHERRPQAHP
jgi:hypothetical protein